jgi:deoxyribonuclease-4
MKLGYHISIGDGLTKTAQSIRKQNLTAVQIFPGSPRSYFPGTNHTIDDYLAMSNLNIPKFVHINYYVNLCGENEVIQKSIAENMLFCDRINADGLVIHMGSYAGAAGKGLAIILENLRVANEKYREIANQEPRVKILIETTAEGGNRLKWNSMLALKELLPKTGICYDTAHMYAAGYDVVKHIEENYKLIDLVHLNNPSPIVEFGKHKDQHDISLFSDEGKFSKREIDNIVNLCKLYDIPMVMETGDMENDLLICEKYKI